MLAIIDYVENKTNYKLECNRVPCNLLHMMYLWSTLWFICIQPQTIQYFFCLPLILVLHLIISNISNLFTLLFTRKERFEFHCILRMHLKMLIRLTTIKLPIHLLLFLFMAFKIGSAGFVQNPCCRRNTKIKITAKTWKGERKAAIFMIFFSKQIFQSELIICIQR